MTADQMTSAVLKVVGAREHNLKNLTLEIPHHNITVITGVSGSGKSSLAFDVIFAEGQRRFMESMSAYARQFVEQMPRPDVDQLIGIPPTVAIEQRVNPGTRKSTVATITEVAQYLRLLYARVGVQHSPATGEALVGLSPDALVKRLQRYISEQPYSKSGEIRLCAPVIRGRKGHHQPLADWAARQGYTQLRIDGQWVAVERFQKLDRYREHDIEVVVATIPLRDKTAEQKNRHTVVTYEAPFRDALKLGKGTCFLATPQGEILSWFSTDWADPKTGCAFPKLDPKHFSWNSAKGWCPNCCGHGAIDDTHKKEIDLPAPTLGATDDMTCPDCDGARLHPISRAVRLHLHGNKSLALPELLQLTPSKLISILGQLKLDRRGRAIAQELIPEIEERLKFMDAVGLGYLTLDRATNTLSGGEAQRIRLAAQLGSNLSGVLYVLDEPSIGLHAQDNARLISSVQTLRNKGNTLLIVEHDEDTLRCADWIIDLGPGAGIHGGEVLAQGPMRTLMRHPQSLTGRYLRESIPHPLRGSYRPLPQLPLRPEKSAAQQEGWLSLLAPQLRNLKGDNLYLPLGCLIMVCGISGSGKSTLIRDLLKPAVASAIKQKQPALDGKAFAQVHRASADPKQSLPFKALLNAQHFSKVIEIDQKPIGKTPRSTPATYIGAFDLIREYFANLPEARMRGCTANTFSFNTKGGRCEKCKGAGRIKMAMHFMPDTFVPCDTCSGKRYSAELDEIRWRGKNIDEVLAMTFEEALEFFSFQPKLKAMLALMVENGLGYLTLGQSSPTLSGGEAQRLKLASELAKGTASLKERSRGTPKHNLYLLEEPTIGLHLNDCEKLIRLCHRLVDQGHTVVVIEHHLDLIAEADYVVEIGPEGGAAGGHILYQGPLSGLLKSPNSPTAPFLQSKWQPTSTRSSPDKLSL